MTDGVAASLTPLLMIGGAAAILAFMVGLIIVAVFQGLRQGIRRERAVKRPCPLHPRCEDRPLTDGPGACRYRSGVISYEQAAAEAAAPAGETPPARPGAPAACLRGSGSSATASPAPWVTSRPKRDTPMPASTRSPAHPAAGAGRACTEPRAPRPPPAPRPRRPVRNTTEENIMLNITLKMDEELGISPEQVIATCSCPCP